MLRNKDAWWFKFFYSVTFGGFVGVAASLTIYSNSEYGLDAKTAVFFTAAYVFAGSLMRPLGGDLADRVGGMKSLSAMYIVAAVALTLASFYYSTAGVALAIFVVGMLAVEHGLLPAASPEKSALRQPLATRNQLRTRQVIAAASILLNFVMVYF